MGFLTDLHPAQFHLHTTMSEEQHLYKIIVIGDYAVGKTCIIKRYCEGVFTPHYKLTIGVDFAVKVVDWDENTSISLQLWDVAGHERFGTMTRVYYKYAIAAVIVFDVSRPATFDAVLKWREDINSKVVLANNEPIPCILLANKCDLPDTNIDTEALDAFVKKHNFILWEKTSAQDDIGIDHAMKELVKEILKVSKENAPQQQMSSDAIRFDKQGNISGGNTGGHGQRQEDE